MLTLIIHKILYAWVPCEIEHLLWHLISHPKNLISVDRDRCCLTVLFAMLTAVALSQWMGVLGWGWPMLAKVCRKIIAAWQLWNNALSSASAADATTNCMTIVLMWKAPYKTMGSLSLGINPMKKCLHGRLRAPGAERYNALECMFIIISDVWNLPLLSCCLPDNPAIVCTSPMSNQWLLFVSLQRSWGSWGLSCPQLGHNIICFP